MDFSNISVIVIAIVGATVWIFFSFFRIAEFSEINHEQPKLKPYRFCSHLSYTSYGKICMFLLKESMLAQVWAHKW